MKMLIVHIFSILRKKSTQLLIHYDHEKFKRQGVDTVINRAATDIFDHSYEIER